MQLVKVRKDIVMNSVEREIQREAILDGSPTINTYREKRRQIRTF